MIERHIIIDNVDPVTFYGVNNSNIQLIRNLFPKLRMAARGSVITVIGDDSETAAVSYRGHTPANLAEDFALVRSAPRDGLSDVERRRLDRLATQIAHQRLTLDFIVTGTSGDANKLEAAAKRLYDFRVAHKADLGYGLWKSFSRKSGELKYWKDVKFFRELVPNISEL